MSSQAPKSSKPTKPQNQNQNQPTSRSSSLSTHLAMVELKQRIITCLSKLADRDTHQIALEELHTITQTISPDALPMLLNSHYDSLSETSNSKPSVKKESLHLLSLACQTHRDLTLPHLAKIISCVVKRLKDSDSSVRDACRDAIGVLSGLYLKGNGAGGEGGGGGDGNGNGAGPMVGLFVRPLFEAMGEQNKVVQSGAAMCMAKMVECAAAEGDDSGGNVAIGAFHKLCPRICKLLNGQSFQAKAALLGVVTSLSQVGAIAPQGLEPLLQNIHDCLGSTDWATRKAAADALSAIALHSSRLIADGAANSTLTVLEACRFDKIKPVRDSMTEALQLWKQIAGKGEGVPDDQKSSSLDGEHHEQAELSDKNLNSNDQRKESLARDASNGTSPTKDSASKSKGGSIHDKAVVILKKKTPALTDKELNLEFFQKLEKRGSGDFPVEVVVPRRCLDSSNLNNEEESEPNDSESRGRPNRMGNSQSDYIHGASNNKFRNIERGITGKESRTRTFDDERIDINHRESSGSRAGFSKSDGQSEGSFINNKGNWLAIQRQLLQLERQQAHLMNMLQDFMGGSHNSMVTLENRVRGLERVVEDLAHDLTISSGRRGNNFAMGFEGSSNRPLGKYNGFSDYSSTKYNGWVPLGERFSQSDVTAPGMRGRGSHWRSDTSDAWEFPTYGASRNGQAVSRRAPGSGSLNVRSPKSEHEGDQVGNRRAWEKGAGPVRHGEGPSARSVWQASKDEATLEAIRVAGEDSGLARTTRVNIPEMTAEAMGDDNAGQERDPIWTSWSNAMDAVKMGDMDTAYAEVVSTGDDLLLVKLMDRSGPVVDQLSNETAREVLHAIGQFLMEQNLLDICLSWIQQLAEIVLENGSHVFGIPMELKKDILLNLHEASTSMEPPEDWEGAAPDQLLLQLASAWGIEIQQFEK
ncbi:PREDICTED: microtubule-associated protein TORTIFOLIA1-like [Populus euphratica]|uniref:Microtubule-associated protein TORTIFOLIA1-like n=1 Tax=Populus euphratica TaxID=75702 RepID=A0AAJ6TDP4_POPEU|nr:PREDICTED: microtubule-associated protein TORTIFOLIA1-like [Populus euphratica]